MRKQVNEVQPVVDPLGRVGESGSSPPAERSQQNAASKRLDLQGVRAIAILVVLAFHFFPAWSPNGYLGVDMFLVLSGFLMAMLLEKAKEQSLWKFVINFYLRRLQRIVPLYYIMIIISLTSIVIFLQDTAVQYNEISAQRALVFISNRQKSESEDYFALMNSAVDLYAHCWSLSMEVQFYLIVPVIYLIGAKLPKNIRTLNYFFIGLVSFSFFMRSAPNVAFNSTFARTWQFIVGMVTWFQNDGDNNQNTMRRWFSSSYTLIAVLSLVTLWPQLLSADIMRPLVTFSTGFLIMNSKGNALLSSKLLTYIGDISFSLYLIHWPVYAHWKINSNESQLGLFFAIMLSFVCSIGSYEFIEKVYTKMSPRNLGKLVGILFVLNILILHRHSLIAMIHGNEERNVIWDLKNAKNMSFDDAAILNRQWSLDDEKNLFTEFCEYEKENTPYGWCRHKMNSDGGYKVAIFGNSWVANHATVFHEECGMMAKSILQGSAYGCEPLYPTGHLDRCRIDLEKFRIRIEKENPDIGFIITRFITVGNPKTNNGTDSDEDEFYSTMRENLAPFLKSVKKKLFILDAIPRVVKKATEEIVPELRKGTDPKDVDNLLVDLSEDQSYLLARERYAKLVQECGEKCELIDYLPTFFNTTTNTFRFFHENGLEYFNWSNHLTPLGLEQIRPIWRNLCEKIE